MPNGEQQGYVYDYATGKFILTTPEEVKAREAWYAQYPGQVKTRDIWQGTTPLPSTPRSAVVIKYTKDTENLLDYWQQEGYITQAQADMYYDQAMTHVEQYGLTSAAPLVGEIEKWKERELIKATTATPENRMERKRAGIAERIAEEKQLGVEQAPAMTDYTNKKYAIIGNPSLTFQRKDIALRELSMNMQKIGLTKLEATQLYNDAKLLAFQQLPKQEQATMQSGAMEISEAQTLGLTAEEYRRQKTGIKSPEQLAAEAEQKRKWDELKTFYSMNRQRVTKL